MSVGGLWYVSMEASLLEVSHGKVRSITEGSMMKASGKHPGWASKIVLQEGMARLQPWERPADRGHSYQTDSVSQARPCYGSVQV